MARRKEDPCADPIMGAEFQPLRTLWEGPHAPYPSEQSARWAFRQLESLLAASGALGLHRGMVYVNVQKLLAVARERAIAQATRRYEKKGCK